MLKSNVLIGSLIPCFSFAIILLLSFTSTNAQTTGSSYSIFLTSNLVDIKQPEAFTHRLDEILSHQKNPFTFIINGDLVDSKFKKNFEKDSVRIANILTALSKYDNGNIIIVPGDRDWDDSGNDGLKNVKKLESLIKSLKLKNVTWAVKKGCPGPNDIELTESLLLVAVNTQWWNHPFETPGPIDGDCKVSTTDDFKEELEDILNVNQGKNIIIAGHFPIISGGEYGGHRPFYKHIFPLTDFIDGFYFPLPLLGSFYQSFRKNIGNTKDIVNNRFETVRYLIGNIISDFNSLVYLSGHEKNQQIIEMKGNYFINSGAPENAEYSSDIEKTILSESKPGIIELIYNDESVSSVFHCFSKSEISNTNFDLLKIGGNDLSQSEVVEVKTTVPSLNNNVNEQNSGMTKVIAGPEYKAGNIKKLFFGAHYRDAWTAEVGVPYLNLDTTKGGLTVLKKGGGRQTLSLVFNGNDGIRYTFRSVNKNPIKALDYALRKTVIAEIVKDQTTTQHPYGALAADILLNALGIIHAHPKLCVMPDNPKLGRFRDDFAGMLGMLEENPANPEKGETGYLGASEILRSNKLFRKLYNDHDDRVDTKKFAVARAFDILVGDWGKHEDNWKWVGFKKDDKTIFEPMPRDRDHVFSRWDGIFPWLADREWAKESGENFDYEISGLRSLMFQARHLDRFIGSDLSKQDWLDAAKFVQSRITDDVIEAAVHNMPKETYESSGKEIESKLKARIKDLDKYVIEYYEMISPEVDVVGSNKDEYFDAIRNTDGTIDVKVFNVVDGGKGNDLIYSRIFFDDETDDIRLYGLGGNDVFNIEGTADESIQIRIIGGSGKDSINDSSESSSPTLVYDRGNKTKINKGINTEIENPFNESLYHYNRTAYSYDTYFPFPFIFFNADDGVIISLGINFTLHNFEKEDYCAKHNIRLSASTKETYGIAYSLRLHHVFSGWDVMLKGHYDDPLPNIYFYGYGNETSFDKDRYLNNYYRTRYSSKGLSAGLIYDFWRKSSFTLEIGYENNERQSGHDNTILATDEFVGKDKINLVEGAIGLNLDFRDHSVLPSSGTRLFAEYKNGLITNLNNERYDKLFAMAEGYTTFPVLLPVTLGLRAGGGESFGKIPFYNQFILGRNTYLKGFRNNRFTGTSMLFFQSMLRTNIFRFDDMFVPLYVGVAGFFNSGKIIQNGETSDKWHNGYGFGFYFIPLSADFTIHTIFSFSKEESFLFELGIGSTL